MKVSSRLQNISQFCEQSVDVTMYKYGWHKDTDLRQAAVMKAESKLRESSSPGLRCFIAVAVVGLCNLLLIGTRPVLRSWLVSDVFTTVRLLI